jgi:hypothetical protein
VVGLRGDRRSALTLSVPLARYLRWWVGYAYGRTVVMVLIFGLSSLYYMPSPVMEGKWDGLAGIAFLLLFSVTVVSLPAVRWRLELRRRAEGRTGRHASETPPWS